MLDDGAAAAAFFVPEFNNMTHWFSLPAVSVYTAELVAIGSLYQQCQSDGTTMDECDSYSAVTYSYL